jgi:hypothetical protein
MPLRQALNVVWFYLTKDADRKGVETLRANMLRPLPGMSEQVSEEVVSAEMAMFKSALSKKI